MKATEKSTFIEEETIELFNNKIEFLENENHLFKYKIEEQDEKLKAYVRQIRLLTHQKFGTSSKKVINGQISLFNEAEKESTKKMDEPDLEEITFNRRKGHSKTRKKYDIRTELKYIPTTLKIVYHEKQVCACRNCDFNGDEGTI